MPVNVVADAVGTVNPNKLCMEKLPVTIEMAEVDVIVIRPEIDEIFTVKGPAVEVDKFSAFNIAVAKVVVL